MKNYPIWFYSSLVWKKKILRLEHCTIKSLMWRKLVYPKKKKYDVNYQTSGNYYRV